MLSGLVLAHKLKQLLDGMIGSPKGEHVGFDTPMYSVAFNDAWRAAKRCQEA
ncbi:hypothetical protein MLPF_0747 [Mycobacterium lepromatosis]|nr:hypothetical protein MLPF_0747 [Mycobacterium lepromatosis]